MPILAAETKLRSVKCGPITKSSHKQWSKSYLWQEKETNQGSQQKGELHCVRISVVNWKTQSTLYLRTRNNTHRSNFLNVTHAVQNLLITECSLEDREGQDVTQIRTLPHEMLFYVRLYSHEGLKLRLGWHHHSSLDTTLLQTPMQMLPELSENAE